MWKNIAFIWNKHQNDSRIERNYSNNDAPREIQMKIMKNFAQMTLNFLFFLAFGLPGS